MDTINIIATVVGTVALFLAVYHFHREKTEDKPEKTGLIYHMKDGIKIYRLELYRNITIAYLHRPKDATYEDAFTYHFFWKGELQYADSQDLEELRTMAVEKIDELID